MDVYEAKRRLARMVAGAPGIWSIGVGIKNGKEVIVVSGRPLALLSILF